MYHKAKTWWLATAERKLVLGIAIGVTLGTIYNQIG